MHDLIPVTPLGGTAPRIDVVGSVTITENTDRALAYLASRLGRDEDCARLGAEATGSPLPGPGRYAAGAPVSAFWTGPGQWMVIAPLATHEDLAVQLGQRLGDAASVTEQTDGWCGFDVEGALALAVFERLCAVDTAAMEAGRATRTVIDHLGCFLICHAAGMRFSVLGPRSSAGSLHHALLTTARSVA